MTLEFYTLRLIALFLGTASAMPLTKCPYQSPAMQTLPYLEKVVYFDDSPPMCADDFLAFLQKDKTRGDKNLLWQKAFRIAQKNVRTLHCDDGKLNVVFKNKKVFLTNAHAFYSSDDKGMAKTSFSNNEIHHCYVMNGSNKNYVDINTPPIFGDPTKDSSLDYAVGAVEQAIDDVEPIELASPEDYARDQEVMVAAAYRGNSTGRNCFTGALCFDRKIWRAIGELSSMHASNCPSDFGASAAAEFLISPSTNRIVLGHLHVTGTYPTDENGQRVPDGKSYFYSKNIRDPNAAYSLSIGIDGVYRQKIDAFIKEIEKKNPPGSLDPQPHQQDAEYVPQGQSL